MLIKKYDLNYYVGNPILHCQVPFRYFAISCFKHAHLKIIILTFDERAQEIMEKNETNFRKFETKKNTTAVSNIMKTAFSLCF